MVKAVTKTVYIADDGSEHLTEDDAHLAEAAAIEKTAANEVGDALTFYVAHGSVEQDDALTFMFDEREKLRAWFDAVDARQQIERQRAQVAVAAPSRRRPATEEDEYGG